MLLAMTHIPSSAGPADPLIHGDVYQARCVRCAWTGVLHPTIAAAENEVDGHRREIHGDTAPVSRPFDPYEDA